MSAELIKKKVVYSGAQPTGVITLGNYLGALTNWVKMSKEQDCFFAVADMHSITVSQVPADLRKNSLDLLAMYVAIGLDPTISTLFLQSQVKEHAELAWVLNCFCMFGEASRMIQFKEKSKKNPDNVNVGLFSYPVLQAADILLYNTDYVPIGVDQRQHVELTRVVAERFNSRFSPTFVLPEAVMPKVGAKINSLIDPTAKMSKSAENMNGTILMLDSSDDIMRKFKRAVTDSGDEIRFDEKNKAGISSLLSIYSAVTGVSIKDAEKQFSGFSYAEFKESVAQSVINLLAPIQTRFFELQKDKAHLTKIMQEGAEKARSVAYKTLRKVYKKIGFVI